MYFSTGWNILVRCIIILCLFFFSIWFEFVSFENVLNAFFVGMNVFVGFHSFSGLFFRLLLNWHFIWTYITCSSFLAAVESPPII